MVLGSGNFSRCIYLIFVLAKSINFVCNSQPFKQGAFTKDLVLFYLTPDVINYTMGRNRSPAYGCISFESLKVVI